MSDRPTENVLRFGSQDGPQALTPLRAGPLELFLDEGSLRYIRQGSRELVRRIYIAVRDRNWGTVPARLSVVRLDARADAFDVVCEANCRRDEIDFFWRGAIRGEPSGRISFTLEGEARTTFLRNRIGFCVLHPPKACRGARCRVGQPDGKTIESAFPVRIAPENPFGDITSLAHEVAPGLWCRLQFDGDLFEMEDQRNWADASFKTFCTPLRLPYPVAIAAGTVVRQSVVLTLEGALPAPGASSASGRSAAIRIELSPQSRRPLPPIGLGAASHGQPLASRELELLRHLQPAHLRVDLRLAAADSGARLAAARDDAASLGAPLEIAAFVSENPEREMGELARWVKSIRPDVCRWLVLHAGEPAAAGARWCRLARSHLAGLCPRAAFGAGTDHSFVEINRRRPPAAELDFVCFSINPQVHAFDNLSLVETVETLGELVECAREIAGPTPLVISPVTLKMRSNPAATRPERPADPGELPPQVDPRQMSLFGGAWTLASAKRLAEAGAASLTYYETTGWRGVMETEAGSPLPGQFPSRPGVVFPLYHVLADIGAFAGGEVVPCASSETLSVAAMVLEKQGRRRILVANLSAQPRSIAINAAVVGGSRIRSVRLHTGNVAEAMDSPVEFRKESGQSLSLTDGAMRLVLTPCELLRLDVDLAP